jgi:hypothetical protein
MSGRFENLKKIPPEPAARMLAMANSKLQTPLKSPASAPVPVVLAELEAAGASFDMLHLLAVALPVREATWWACLAARDLIGHDEKKPPACLAAAEDWVFRPGDETREAARLAIETADMDDETTFCAMAALYSDGTLGPGDLKEYPAPPNALAASVTAMNLKALAAFPDEAEAHLDLLIERGLDIARGGNGRVASTPTTRSPNGDTMQDATQ